MISTYFPLMVFTGLFVLPRELMLKEDDEA
jgi:hypothetical protein